MNDETEAKNALIEQLLKEQKNFAMDIENVINGVKIRDIQHSEIDRKNGLLTSHDHYTIVKGEGEPEICTNSFSLQIYTARIADNSCKK